MSELSVELSELLQTSSHSTFQQVLQPLLLPCLTTVATTAHDSPSLGALSAPSNALQGSASGSAAEGGVQIQMQGSAWVMLGMLRLHLAAPPAGADPVGKYAFKKAHLERILSEDVMPETEVRPAAHLLGTIWKVYTVVLDTPCS